jgi:hypothetical protein
MPLPEEHVWRRRARDALERDGNSLEGALGSQSRRGLAREGRPAPERGGVPLEGASDPRARRNFTRGGNRPTSEAELYRGGAVPLDRSRLPPEGGWADRLTGRGFVGLFCACVYVRLHLFFTILSGFPLVV